MLKQRVQRIKPSRQCIDVLARRNAQAVQAAGHALVESLLDLLETTFHLALGFGDALMHALRPLQDRGQMFTTLSEIHTRADLVVCFGTDATNYPEFFRRCAPAADSGLQRRTVFVSTVPPAQAIEGSSVETVTGQGDLFDTAATLAALVEQRRVSRPAPELAELADALRAARYAVLVWEPAQLPAHGALIGETLLRLVMSLNRSTRAGMFALGGLDGAQTANAAMTWLSGLPLRSRVGPRGLEHQPLQYATDRLLAGDEVDLLLWVASFGPNLPPPACCPSRRQSARWACESRCVDP